MNAADVYQTEALRLSELKDTLSGLKRSIFELAYAETISFGNIEVAMYIDQAQIKLGAAIQAIDVSLRDLCPTR